MGRRGFPPPSSRLASPRIAFALPRFRPSPRLVAFSFRKRIHDDRENGGSGGNMRCFRCPLAAPPSHEPARRRGRSMRNNSAGSNLSTFCRSCISQFLSPSGRRIAYTFNVLRKQIRAMINGVLNKISPIERYVLNRCYSFVVND